MTKPKRYTLSLPHKLYASMAERAEQDEVNVNDIARKCITIGLMILLANDQGDTEIVIRQKKPEREILLQFVT